MILETVKFTINVEKNKFIEASKILQEEFLTKQNGFVSREVYSIDGTNQYIDLTIWDNMDNANLAMNNSMTSTLEVVGNFMSCIDIENAVIEHFEKLN